MSKDKNNSGVPSNPINPRDHSVGNEQYGTFDSIHESDRGGANTVRNSMPAPRNPHRGGEQGTDRQGD